MPITVNGPNGVTINFPDGTDPDTINRVMSEAVGGGAAKAQPRRQPDMSAGEVASDVAKSAGIGVVQGGIGLATLPGNLEALGRAGINAAAGLVGAQPPVSGDTFLPNYNDWKGKVEGYTGEFYKPKTTLGEYARTGGEFASLALGGGGLAARGARVALPAAVSETAGQATSGTELEPWARMAGAFAGGRLPNTAARAITPAPQNAARRNAVQTLEREGVDAITAGQRTGNARLRQVEDATAMFPGGGGRATAMQQQAAEQFTAAALRRAGINADRAEPDVINAAFANIGREYQNFAHATSLPASSAVSRAFRAIGDRYITHTSDAMRINGVEALAAELARRFSNMPQVTGGVSGLTGAQYNAIRSELARAQRNFRNDPQANRALGDMIATLDNALVRSTPVGQRAAVRDALRDRNRRYRNLLIIEDAMTAAGEAAASGLISPAALKNAIKKNDKKGYTRNRNDMAPLARSGVEVLTPLRSSGTAERNFAQGVVSAPSAIGAGAVGVLSGGDPVLTLAGALAPPIIKAATARGIMSEPAQRYFGNQRVPQNIEPIPTRSVAPLAVTQFAQEPDIPLRGGSGPRYKDGRRVE
jgi:hypothetical protein